MEYNDELNKDKKRDGVKVVCVREDDVEREITQTKDEI